MLSMLSMLSMLLALAHAAQVALAMSVRLQFFKSDGITIQGEIHVINTPDTLNLAKTVELVFEPRPKRNRQPPPASDSDRLADVVWRAPVMTYRGALSSNRSTQAWTFTGPFGRDRPDEFFVRASAIAAAASDPIVAIDNAGGNNYLRISTIGSPSAASAFGPSAASGPAAAGSQPAGTGASPAILPAPSTVSGSSDSSAPIKAANSPEGQPAAGLDGSQSAPQPTVAPLESWKIAVVVGSVGIAAMALVVGAVAASRRRASRRTTPNTDKSSMSLPTHSHQPSAADLSSVAAPVPAVEAAAPATPAVPVSASPAAVQQRPSASPLAAQSSSTKTVAHQLPPSLWLFDDASMSLSSTSSRLSAWQWGPGDETADMFGGPSTSR
ncbi:hypothetical protein BC831DRAFT_444367 [Entophlyctis helioformis]|nr:hypothetical protein BC831DRAFT_444367 [Entophlyctis helioformis]